MDENELPQPMPCGLPGDENPKDPGGPSPQLPEGSE